MIVLRCRGLEEIFDLRASSLLLLYSPGMLSCLALKELLVCFTSILFLGTDLTACEVPLLFCSSARCYFNVSFIEIQP